MMDAIQCDVINCTIEIIISVQLVEFLVGHYTHIITDLTQQPTLEGSSRKIN